MARPCLQEDNHVRNNAIRHADLQARGVPDELVLLAALVDGLGNPHVEGTGRSPEYETLLLQLLGRSTQRPKALRARHVVVRIALDVKSESIPTCFSPHLGHLRGSTKKVDDAILLRVPRAPQKGADLSPVILCDEPGALLTERLDVVLAGFIATDAPLRHAERRWQKKTPR